MNSLQLHFLALWIALVAFVGSVAASEPQAKRAVTPISSRPHAQTVSMLPGIAEPSQMVELSAPMDGVLRRIDVSEGQRVQTDQLLAALDDRVAQASRRVAETTAKSTTSVQKAKMQLAAARTYLKRIQQAHASGAASDLELDQAQDRVHDAETALHQSDEQKALALAQLALEEQRLESHFIRAPFPGRVIQINGKIGQSMTRADSVLSIANLETLHAELHIPIRWFGKLKVNQRFELIASHPVNRMVSGKLISSEPIINTATNTFRCVFEIDNSDKALPAGFSVRLVEPSFAPESVDPPKTTKFNNK